ncbi:TlpA family protein disulfide reductase [Caldivirga maquilingensis]|uniref:Alkyl hydroperoxide reductase/ Thiol specific antioxidant/ Mal allergen n=1 Tax=Caldivirga maquilingensis (strain ATCC 700844 / DSM 13496 / JCM 10307 / IC-167) TaxID=397948 RepID=A8M9B2_CALMQ|nr:redoxin domain-containing protein [Caldivirga maquilingensis]ABW02331.1 alkyl hydroperoxide reductase/ Thiol specific antioxidant/ Mal allergen [Caldivirga maquilingensis IC-167]
MRTRTVILVIASIVVLSTVVYLFTRPTRTTGVSVGYYAPDSSFELINGTSVKLYDFLNHGHYVLVYFVSTWCSDCAIGLIMLSHRLEPILQSHNVIVLVLENYNDLGYQGEPVNEFVSYFAGNSSKYFTVGIASLKMTETYNPEGYPEIYYLIAPNGKIIYENTDLAGTYNSLISIVNGLGNS